MKDQQRERLIEIIQNSVGGCARNWAEVIAGGLLSEGVIVTPCKVGDTVFVTDIPAYEGMVTECVVLCFHDVDENGVGSMDYEPIEDIPDVVSIGSFTDEIGKTVFLTREEAERALGKEKK